MATPQTLATPNNGPQNLIQHGGGSIENSGNLTPKPQLPALNDKFSMKKKNGGHNRSSSRRSRSKKRMATKQS